MSDGSANKDRKKYCAWRGLSIKGQSFLTDLSSNRNDKKGEWQEEKSRGREIRRLASTVPVSALLAVFSNDIQSAENGGETNCSRQKTEQLCCCGGQPATCLLFPRPFGIWAGHSTWGSALHGGQGDMRAGSCLCSTAPGAYVRPAGAGHLDGQTVTPCGAWAMTSSCS